MFAVKQLQTLVFRILGMILWLAPLGAFGAIAAVVGKTGFAAILSLGVLMIAFYITCAVFIVGILGTLLYVVARINIFRLMKYLAREYLLIVGDLVVRVRAASTHREDGAPGRREAGRGHHRSDRLLVQPRRHRDLPHDGVAVHRVGHGHADVDPRADRAAGVHDHRVEGCCRRHRCGTRDPRRRPAGVPPRPRRRRRRHRRHRPVHVRGSRADELHRQRGGHGPHRHLDQGVRQEHRLAPCCAARSAVRRDDAERATTTTGCRMRPTPSAFKGWKRPRSKRPSASKSVSGRERTPQPPSETRHADPAARFGHSEHEAPTAWSGLRVVRRVGGQPSIPPSKCSSSRASCARIRLPRAD